MRLVDEAEENRPEWLICENVKNLLSIDGGRGFFEVLTEMGGEGTLLNGAFTTRKITEYLKTESVSTLPDIMESQPDSRYYLSDEKVQQLLDRIVGGSQGERVYDGNKISCTLSSQGGGCGAKTGLYTFVDINKKGSVQTTDTARALLARYHKGQPNRPAECSGVIEVRPVIQSLGNATPYKNDYTVLATGISRTLMACSYKHVPQVALNNELADGQVRIRRLTPKECFRLQGFADEQFDQAAAVNSETQLYKQAGNAVTVNVVEAIGRHIKEVASKIK